MTRERFAEEFKSEAVRQVVERGYTVPPCSGSAPLKFSFA